MAIRLTHVQIWVLDQDEALDWYTNKLGFEVREDVTVPELDNFRWLSVGPPGQDDVKVTLMAIPGQPVFDAETEQAVRDALARGGAGGLFFETDDIQATYDRLKERGVEVTDEPTERPYGIDMGLRDPFGNHFRMMQATAE